MCMIGGERGLLEQREVLAWRAWRVRPDGRVMPVHHTRQPWRCATWTMREPPKRTGRTGLWAFRLRRSAERYARKQWRVVAGLVRLSGVVIKHTGGYRAQRAEILAFIDSGDGAAGAAYLAAARYGVKILYPNEPAAPSTVGRADSVTGARDPQGASGPTGPGPTP